MKAGSEAVGDTDATPTTFFTYAVYRSARSSGDPARDFQEEWKLLMGPYQLRSELKSGTRDWGGGWKLTMGVARMWGEQQRNFTSILSVFTGYGVKASILVNYNDRQHGIVWLGRGDVGRDELRHQRADGRTISRSGPLRRRQETTARRPDRPGRRRQLRHGLVAAVGQRLHGRDVDDRGVLRRQLNLKPDGSYDYKFAGASGVVGAMNIQTDDARGRWEIQGDLLVLTRDSGKQMKYRIAGLTQFPSGEKGAVFMRRLDLPVNPTTVTNGGDYYATKAR